MSALPIRDDGVKRLAAYLKENPEGAKRPPSDLAREFGLDTLFVAQVLRGLKRPKTVLFGPTVQATADAIKRGITGLIELVRRSATLIAVVSLYAAAVVFAVGTTHAIGIGSHYFALRDHLQHSGLGVLCEVIALHCFLFFLSGSPRAVLVGVANLGVILLGTVIQVTMLSPSTPGIASVLGLNPLLIGLICGIYAIIGGFAAGVGAMWRLSRKDDEELMLSRHQLLERLFDFESRLVAAKDEGDKTRYLLPRRLIMPFRRWPVWSAVVCGIIIGGCQLVLGSGALSQGPAVGADAAMSARLSILLLLLVLLAGVVYFVSAFACDRLLTGLGRNLLMYLTSTAVALLPLNGYGPDFFVSNEFLTDRRVIFLFFLILSVLGFLMSRLEERVSVRARLDANDPAALLAEMVRIEWLLSARHQEVAVVSVDVARSTEMKANCDPLAAEYSFREYQNFIRNICHAAGGFVHSTAGDGAILAFPTAEKAFQAAREIQTGISYFNEHVNKMPAKFRLRVGIHMGETPDDIRQVEYTEVIDIASHVQEVAPIRGIVVTKPVAEHLPEEQLIQLRDPVEGFEVFLAHNPTVDM